MNTTEILSKLEQVDFTTDQARIIAEIFEDHRNEPATREDVKMTVASEVSRAKYDLVKWIVGGIIANGVIAALLKFLA